MGGGSGMEEPQASVMCDHEPLLAAGPGPEPGAAPTFGSPGFVAASSRPRRDVGWARAYVLTQFLTFVLGFAVLGNTNKSFDYLTTPSVLEVRRACCVSLV